MRAKVAKMILQKVKIKHDFYSCSLLFTFTMRFKIMKLQNALIALFIFSVLLFVHSGCKKNDSSDNGPVPVINGISPSSGTKGTVVTISGTGFTSHLESLTVLLNGKEVVVVAANETSIQFEVPPKIGSGLVAVDVHGKSASGPWFTFVYTITVSTVSGQPGIAGFADGNASVAKFNNPRGLTIDSQGNLYVADELNHRIRRVSPGGTVITFAGMGLPGHADGVPGIALFNHPFDIDLDAINGYFYVADKFNHCVRRISLTGDVTTAVGIPGSPGYVDAPGLAARLNNPTGIALEGELLNMYIADGGNHCIRKYDQFGVVTTFAGSTVDGQQDGIGAGAKFSMPFDIAWDSSGYLFVSDKVNNNIRRIKKSSVDVITVAGVGSAGFLDGPSSLALFSAPEGVCSWFNEVLVCDSPNERIRKISPAKNVTTLAGDGNSGFADGSGAQAKLNSPGGIVRNTDGDYFISDTGNNCIRKMVVD
jgi:uncharacterized protein (TIGR03437 family)